MTARRRAPSLHPAWRQGADDHQDHRRLAAQGFVRREGSKEDGRMMLVFLTDAGRDQIKSVRKSQRRTEKAAFDRG